MEKMNESDNAVIIPAHNEGLHIGRVNKSITKSLNYIPGPKDPWLIRAVIRRMTPDDQSGERNFSKPFLQF